jgi:hypothetical protein
MRVSVTSFTLYYENCKKEKEGKKKKKKKDLTCSSSC